MRGACSGRDATMSAMGTTPTTGPASGRPRDPGLEARVLDAAFSVYARRGWAGFTSEEVARQAGVGKSSLYLRWPTKLAVLLDSIRLRERDNVVADTGDLRHDLLAFARQTFDRLNGEDGAVTLRLVVESRFYDDLRDGLSSAAHVEQLHAVRAIVRRAIERGDLPAGASVTLISDMIAGSVLNHTLVTPPHLRDAMEAKSGQFFEQLVDVVLAGVERACALPPPD
jgi:AcrR family transcriptional regulator